jgi:hypothetical protein
MNRITWMTVFGLMLALSSCTSTKVAYIDCPYVGVMPFHCPNWEPGVIRNKQ